MAEMGRPSKYDPSFCDAVIADGEAGLSLTAFAGGIGVCRDTITEWMNVHDDFSLAVKKHKAARTRYLETTLLSADQGPRVTARIFALKNAAPEEWKDKTEIEHSVSMTHEARKAEIDRLLEKQRGS